MYKRIFSYGRNQWYCKKIENACINGFLVMAKISGIAKKLKMHAKPVYNEIFSHA
jgi:hypothetical protein